MDLSKRRLKPPTERRSVGLSQLAVALTCVLAGFVLGFVFALNYSSALHQHTACISPKPTVSRFIEFGRTGFLGLGKQENPVPCMSAEEKNVSRLASPPSASPQDRDGGGGNADGLSATPIAGAYKGELAASASPPSLRDNAAALSFPPLAPGRNASAFSGADAAMTEPTVPLPSASSSAESTSATSHSEEVSLVLDAGGSMAQAAVLSGPGKAVAGPASGGGTLSLEEAVRLASVVDRLVVVVLATASNLRLLHNWYASVFMAGYGSQVIFLAEDSAAYEQIAARWPTQTVLLEPHKLNLTSGPRVPQCIRMLLSFDVTVVYNEVDVVWVSDPFLLVTGPHDVWVTEERPSHAMAANPAAAYYVAPKEATRRSSQELGLSFMVFRPTHGSRLLLDMWIVEARSHSSTNAGGLVPFNKAVRASAAGKVSVGVLSPYVFPSGHVYFPCSDRSKCRKYWNLQRWYWVKRTQQRQSVAVVHANGFTGSANTTTAALVQRLVDHRLWFVIDFDELLRQAREGVVAAREDLGRSQAEREALVVQVLPGAATRHGDDGMTLAEAVEVVGGPNRTLIFCSASEGYLDFLINWFKSVQRAGQGDKVLFIAEDHVAYDFLRQRWPKQTVLVVDGPAGRGQPTRPARAVGGGGPSGRDAKADAASLNGGSSYGSAAGAVTREEEDEAAVMTSRAGVSMAESASSDGKQGTVAAAAAGAELGDDASSIPTVGEDMDPVLGEEGVPAVAGGEEGEEGLPSEVGADEKGRRRLLWKRVRSSKRRGGTGGARSGASRGGISGASKGGSSGASSSSTRGSAAHLFGTNIYNTLVDRRPKYFEALLLLNVTFLYNDVDIVWFRDAWPLFTGDYDMWVQEDRPRERSEGEEKTTLASTASHAALRHASEYICTCIMMLRPTPGSLTLVRLWTHVLHFMQRRAGGKPVPNQPAFNMALQFTRQDNVRVGVLPIQLFPSGYLHFPCGALLGCSKMQRLQKRYWALKDAGTIRPAMVHNNWIKGYAAKLERFKALKMWSVTANDVVPTRSRSSFPAPLANSSHGKSV